MIYLDNSATTAISAEAKSAMLDAMDNFANPSSLHKAGQAAGKILTSARKSVANALGLRSVVPGQILFTSGGTEANNTAIFGTVYAKKRRISNRIISTDSEHPSVENALQRLEADGFEVIRISTRGGVFDIDAFEKVMDNNVLLVSVMMVNNETGAVYDVQKIFSAAKRKNPDVITHCDAVQGYLKIPFSPQKLGADLVSISAHKIHGPKGIGALYVSPEIIKTKKIIPYMIGGGQESGLRSGTENVLGMVGFSAAAKVGFDKLEENREKMLNLRQLAEAEIIRAGAQINTPMGARAPHIISVRLPSIKSETMLNFLSAKGICVSAGSACSSHSQHISSALVGFGLTKEQADSTIRVSLSDYNTEDEIKELGQALSSGISMLVRFKR